MFGECTPGYHHGVPDYHLTVSGPSRPGYRHTAQCTMLLPQWFRIKWISLPPCSTRLPPQHFSLKWTRLPPHSTRLLPHNIWPESPLGGGGSRIPKLGQSFWDVTSDQVFIALSRTECEPSGIHFCEQAKGYQTEVRKKYSNCDLTCCAWDRSNLTRNVFRVNGSYCFQTHHRSYPQAQVLELELTDLRSGTGWSHHRLWSATLKSVPFMPQQKQNS